MKKQYSRPCILVDDVVVGTVFGEATNLIGAEVDCEPFPPFSGACLDSDSNPCEEIES